MNYKQECTDWLANYDVEVDKTEFQHNQQIENNKDYLKKRIQLGRDLVDERKEKGDKWFYFKRVEQKGVLTNSTSYNQEFINAIGNKP